MSKYVDILVYKDTKEKLKRFAETKGLTLAQLLEGMANRLDELNSSKGGPTNDTK